MYDFQARYVKGIIAALSLIAYFFSISLRTAAHGSITPTCLPSVNMTTQRDPGATKRLGLPGSAA